jgi:hypothetical protein
MFFLSINCACLARGFERGAGRQLDSKLTSIPPSMHRVTTCDITNYTPYEAEYHKGHDNPPHAFVERKANCESSEHEEQRCFDSP